MQTSKIHSCSTTAVLAGSFLLNRPKTVLLSTFQKKLDGTKSLQIGLDGVWTPDTPLLSQTIIVEPETTYRLAFSVKTKDLVTGGPPVITMSDATNNQLLGQVRKPSHRNEPLGQFEL